MEGRPLVVFDMDGVLVHQRSSWGMVHDQLGTSNEDSHESYKRREIDDMEFMRRDIALWRGERPDITIGEIERILENATIMNGFAECMDSLRERGAALAIISGGLDLLARRLERTGGFHFSFANGLEADARGRLTGEGRLVVPLREKGGVLSRELLLRGGFGPVISVGDSSVDISLFRMSDMAIAFRAREERVRMRANLAIDGDDLAPVAREVLGALEKPPKWREPAKSQ